MRGNDSALQVRLDHQVAADVVVAKQADELAVAHDGQALVAFAHHRFINLRELGVRRQRGQVGVHRLGDERVGTKPVGRVEHILPHDDAEQTVAIHDGEIILSRVINHLEAAHHGDGGREHDKIPRHHLFDFEVAQKAPGADDFFLALGADEDEDADDDEPERELQPDQHEQDCQRLTDRRGDDGGAREWHDQRQHGAQQASPVHRESGNEVENKEREVCADHGGEETRQVVRHRKHKQIRRQSREWQQRGSNGEINSRP